MSAARGRRKLSRWQTRCPRLDVDGVYDGWMGTIPPEKRHFCGGPGIAWTSWLFCRLITASVICCGCAGACVGAGVSVSVRASERGRKKVMCSKGGRGFGSEAQGVARLPMACQGQRDKQTAAPETHRQRERVERFARAVVETASGGLTWWNRRRLDQRGSRAEQEAVEQGGSAEDKRLQIEDKAHDLEGLRPGQGIRPLARMGLDRWKRCDWPGRLCVC